MFLPVKNEFFINFIAENNHVRKFFKNLYQRLEFFAGINRAGGIGRRIENKDFGFDG